MAQVGTHFQVRAALLIMGAARVPEAGPSHLTLTAEEGIKAAVAFPDATIVPLHYEGWAHFRESREQIARAFANAGIEDRLRWGEPGREIAVSLRRPEAAGLGRRKAIQRP